MTLGTGIAVAGIALALAGAAGGLAWAPRGVELVTELLPILAMAAIFAGVGALAYLVSRD